MGFIGWADERAKRFGNIYDLKLAGFMSLTFALLLAKLFPVLLSLDAWFYAIVFVIFAARPIILFFK